MYKAQNHKGKARSESELRSTVYHLGSLKFNTSNFIIYYDDSSKTVMAIDILVSALLLVNTTQPVYTTIPAPTASNSNTIIKMVAFKRRDAIERNPVRDKILYVFPISSFDLHGNYRQVERNTVHLKR